MKLLVVRSDKMGDVLLALPALLQLRRALPDYPIDFCCGPDPLSLIEPTLRQWDVRGILPEEAPRHLSSYRGILFLDTSAALLRKAWLKGVPLRVSLYSKLWSLVCLTDGLRQRRSYGAKNEALYNWDLAELFLKKINDRAQLEPPSQDIVLKGDEETSLRARTVLQAAGVDLENLFYLIHPGMGGSALNLSAENYSKVIEKIRGKAPLVLSVGPSDADRKLKAALLSRHSDLRVIEGETLPVLREVFRLADTVLAPSTGPLHLAHLVGAKTVGFYPPVQSQRKERWAPFGGKAPSTVLSPKVKCPGKRDCIGSSCPDYYCMDRWDWASQLPF
jgi:ADP-heptose:LPS heptosyltransferase